MAACSSSLAWRIPWTEEPGGLQSKGLQSWTEHVHACFFSMIHLQPSFFFFYQKEEINN